MVDLSCYHHDPSPHEFLVSFAHGPAIPADQCKKETPANGHDLSSSRDPYDERPCRCAQGKRRRNSERKMPLEAMSRLIQEFFPSIATLLRSMLHGSYAILYRIGNRACCARSLVS
jgi:hypothetical protein